MTSLSRTTPSNLARAGDVADAWQSTRAHTSIATKFLEEQDEHLDPKIREIGRQTGVNEHELFVSCSPQEALQQQFEHLRPEFIAVHDIATLSSRKLLIGIAAASSRAVQKLVIRRQGYGTSLATLEFVDLPTADGSSLRMYSTEADADTASRHALAHMLLAYSQLGVIMFGDLPGHSIASSLKPFQEAINAGPWQNRQLLLLPLAGSGTLSAHGAELSRGNAVNVRTSPQVTRPADAWSYISSTWERLHDHTHTQPMPPLNTAPVVAPFRSSNSASLDSRHLAAPSEMSKLLSMQPISEVSTISSRGFAQRSLLDRYVHQLMELPGMVSCCIFDVTSGLEVTCAGASPGATDLAIHGKALLAGISASSRKLGLGDALPEAAITLGSHHLLLHAIPNHPNLAMHACLDKNQANLTLVRLQVQRMDSMFDSDAHA